MGPGKRLPFWLLCIIPIISYAFGFALCRITSHYRRMRVPIPSMVVCTSPEYWLLAGPAPIVTLCIFLVSIWAFKLFRPGILPFLLLLSGIAGSVFYSAMSFVVLTKNQRLHFGLHCAWFVSLDVFFGIVDVLQFRRKGFSGAVTIYDLLLLIVQCLYLPFWRVEVGFQRIPYTNLIASCGYAAIAFIAVRFPILGGQLYGEDFMPSEKRKAD
jgi:hypothetical protein